MDQFQEQLISLFQGSPLFIASQILGLCLCIISFFIYYLKKREHILITKLISDVLCVIQQAMVGASTGAMINGIAVARELIFYNRGRKKCASHIVWLFVFIGAMGISPVLTWQGPISILPAIGSSLAVMAFYCKRPTHTRIFGLFAQTLWLIYTVVTFNPVAVLQNTIQIVAALLGLLRDYKEYRAHKSSAKESSK
jgi:lipid-A-disaccharide synthase-like uncharacterized protein